MTRAGCGSSSRSNNNNSTAKPLREKTLKFAPPSMTIAPSGELQPGVTGRCIGSGLIGPGPLFLQQLFGNRDDLIRFEAELFLQFLERRGGAEGMHADDPSLRAHITLPAESRGLFHGHPCCH